MTVLPKLSKRPLEISEMQILPGLIFNSVMHVFQLIVNSDALKRGLKLLRLAVLYKLTREFPFPKIKNKRKKISLLFFLR